jgi:hypothetical protein
MIKSRWEEVPPEIIEWLRKQKGNVTLFKTEKGEIEYVSGSMPYLMYEAYLEETNGYLDSIDLDDEDLDADLLCYPIKIY